MKHFVLLPHLLPFPLAAAPRPTPPPPTPTLLLLLLLLLFSFSRFANSNYHYIVMQHITKTRLFNFFVNFTSKNCKFSDKKNPDSFHISAQNIDCGYTLEPPLTSTDNLLSSRNKKNNVYPCKPQVYYIKVGFKGSKLYRHVFVMMTCQCSQIRSMIACENVLSDQGIYFPRK